MSNNKYKLKVFPMARLDMEQIFEYISTDLCNPTAAIELIADFEKAFDAVCSFPESFPYTNNEYIKDKSLRKLIVNNYIAFYKVKNSEIQVIRVLYGMRNFEKLL
jgi:plasmid stabilization system protein ParE